MWGQSEPNTAVGKYAWVSTQDSKWYMGDSGTVRNFVCEMDPCPAGMTFHKPLIGREAILVIKGLGFCVKDFPC